MINDFFSPNIDYKQKIKEDVEKRGIDSLVHFTSINNIPSIIEKGLFSICDLSKQSLTYDFNDTERIEGHSNSISLSIMFPNYSMFSKYRIYMESPKDMAVIFLDPSILWEKDCAFYFNNAANRVFNDVPAHSYKNFNSWESMFCYEMENRLRTDLNIPNFYTTNPQAEILCFNAIESHFINSIHFQDQNTFDQYQHILPNKQKFYYLNEDIYKPRLDYQKWKK